MPAARSQWPAAFSANSLIPPRNLRERVKLCFEMEFGVLPGEMFGLKISF
jgi:hypothetical protein